MLNFTHLFKKATIAVLILALGLASLPMSSAAASGLAQEETPTTERHVVTNARLEYAWARLVRGYEFQGNLLDKGEAFAERVQTLIDRANERGLDTSAVQAALDAFEAALKDAHQSHQQANGIVQAHKGFDKDGKVVDREKAVESVKELGQALREFNGIMSGPFKALREAIREFFENNRPARPERQPREGG